MLTALLPPCDLVWLSPYPLPFIQMLVEDLDLVGNRGSGSGAGLKYHLVAAHGARDIPVSALSNPMNANDIGICLTCNVRFQDPQDLYDHRDGSVLTAIWKLKIELERRNQCHALPNYLYNQWH